MSLRVTVLVAVAVLLVVAFATLGGLTTRIVTYQERVVVLQEGNAPPHVAVRRVQGPAQSPGAFNRRFWPVLALVAFATLLAALYLTNRLVLVPIEALTNAARRMEGGSLSERVQANRRDEIGTLARSFNDLAARLERSEARRKALIADIAHELRTPLTNIRGSIEALQDGVTTASADELRALHDDALLLQRLIGDLHLLSLGDAGMLALECRPTDLASELRTATSPAGSRAALDVTEPLPLVSCDPARVRQVVQNVLANALRYTPADAPIVVRAEQTDEAVRVSVEDGGSGFPPEEADAIFERFYRVDDSRSRETGGTGLGLAIAKQLIEAQRGRIGAFVNERGGATIWFTLPLAPSPAA